MTKIGNHRIVSGNESADRCKRFTERADDQIDTISRTKMFAHARSRLAEDADAVRIVNDESRGMRIAEVSYPRDVRDVAFHAEDPVDDYHLRPSGGSIEAGFQMIEVAVSESNDLCSGKRGAIDHARVIELVDEKHISRTCKRRDDAEVRLVSRWENERCVLVNEVRQLRLEPVVQVGVSVEESAAGARTPILPESGTCGLENARVVCETEVIVRPDHHDALPFDHHFGRVRLLDRKEVGIKPERFYFLRSGVGISLCQHVGILRRACFALPFGAGRFRKTNPALWSRIHKALRSPGHAASSDQSRGYVTPNYMNIRGLRIALFTGAYNHIADGVSLTLNRLVAFLEEQGATVQVYAPTISNPPLKHTGKLVPVPSISAPGRPEYRISGGLRREALRNLTEFDPHLFHIATPDLLGLAALRRARRTKTPVVASYHTHFASYLTYYRLGILEGATWQYLRWFYSQCRQIYVPTGSMMEVLRGHGIDNNLRLWPRGVESDLFNPSRRSREWRRSRSIGESDVVIAFVSRLVTEKGLDVVIDVIKDLSERGVKHKTVIVGDGPERARLQSNLPAAIFEGHLTGEALAAAYASSDIFLFPSDTETFGNVTLEALASGLPAIVADATGSNALVNDGLNGFLVRARDSQAFTERVEQLVRDDELRARMSHAARASAEPYEWKQILSQIVSYYGELE